MDVDFKVEGLAELDRELWRLSERGAKNAKRGALRAGARHLRKAIKAELPRTSGKKLRTWRSGESKGKTENVHLRNRIGIKMSRRGDVLVGYTGLARAYGHIIEFGKSYGRAINSPGIGVWERTAASEASEVIDIVGRTLGEQIVRQIRRGN